MSMKRKITLEKLQRTAKRWGWCRRGTRLAVRRFRRLYGTEVTLDEVAVVQWIGRRTRETVTAELAWLLGAYEGVEIDLGLVSDSFFVRMMDEEYADDRRLNNEEKQQVARDFLSTLATELKGRRL